MAAKLKKGRVLLLFALTVGAIITADNIRRDVISHPDNTIIVTGSFKNSSAKGNNGSDSTLLGADNQPVQSSTSGFSYLGYSETAVPAAQLSRGLLTLIDETHPAGDGIVTDTVNLADVKNDYYSLCRDDLTLDRDAADALNLMMADYNGATELSDFVIYSTVEADTSEGSLCPAAFPESAAGTTIDLAINGAYSMIEYDGADTEAWVTDNCDKYGFIVRYPAEKEARSGKPGCIWHLRYVGPVHSSVMKQNNLCLEEYLEWLKSYTIDNPLKYDLNGVSYEIYYTASLGDSTPVRVPVSGSYTISGNNMDGFIVTAVK